MVRVGDALSAAAGAVAVSVTKFFPYQERKGLPELNVLYTTDQAQALNYMRTRMDGEVFGLDVEWRPAAKRGSLSRTSMIQISSGPWLLVYDALPVPWHGRPAKPLAEKLCNFLQQGNRTFYAVDYAKKAARIAFELNCALPNGVDLKQHPWPGLDLSGGLVEFGNELLNSHVRPLRKLKTSNWERRPLLWPQLHYAVEHAYISWAIADHFLSTKGSPSSRAVVTKAKVYGAGSRIRRVGLAVHKTRYDWARAAKSWAKEQRRRAEEAAAAAEALQSSEDDDDDDEHGFETHVDGEEIFPRSQLEEAERELLAAHDADENEGVEDTTETGEEDSDSDLDGFETAEEDEFDSDEDSD